MAKHSVLVGLCVAVACTTPEAQPCGGHCGPGTECVAEVCQVVAEVEAAEVPEVKRPTKRRRGARKVRGERGDPSEPDAVVAPGPVVDDRGIPEVDDNRTQVMDLKAGSERLSQTVIDQHIGQITPAIQRCIAAAGSAGEEARGKLSFRLQINPSGKVEAVSLTPPKAISTTNIPACARKAVYDHRFPAFDGMAMTVRFAVEID